MKYRNEIAVKKALGINSFRNLSRENVMRFAAMMPDIDMEVALKIVEQFPEFKAFAIDAIDAIQHAQGNTLAENRASQDQVHEAWRAVREILKGQLDDSDLSWEQKQYILNLILETAREQGSKDSENKQFVKDVPRITLTAISAAVLMAVVFVGGKVGLEQLVGNDDESS